MSCVAKVDSHDISKTSVALAIALLSLYPIEVSLALALGKFDLQESLPFHLCDLTAVIGAFGLLTGNSLARDLTYFWGLAGTPQALLTPVFPSNLSVSHPIVWHYIISHALIIGAAFYVVLVLGHKPRWHSVWIAFLLANVYAAVALGINAALLTNYGFLCHKPAPTTALNFLGPWPYYILSLQFLAIFCFLLLYLPFSRYYPFSHRHANGDHH